MVQRPNYRTCATAFGEEYDMQPVAEWTSPDADRGADWRQAVRQTATTPVCLAAGKNPLPLQLSTQ